MYFKYCDIRVGYDSYQGTFRYTGSTQGDIDPISVTIANKKSSIRLQGLAYNIKI